MPSIVVMGVSAAGKSAVGEAIAAARSVRFVDGDDLHPAANVAKMASGTPLTDDDRAPWLDTVGDTLRTDEVVVACSALRRAYRDRIRRRVAGPVRFVHLAVSEPELRRRIERRADHFMPPSLLTDQLATLEAPNDEDDVLVIDADQPIEAVIAATLAALA